jgi:hypothetical protein
MVDNKIYEYKSRVASRFAASGGFAKSGGNALQLAKNINYIIFVK